MVTSPAESRTVGRTPLAAWLIIVLLALGAVAGLVYLVSLPASVWVVAVSTWLHTLATIVFIGYFLFTGLIYLPLLERRVNAATLRELLEQVSFRLRPLFGGSLLIFLVTGTHLMLVNPGYLGLGNFFANPWSVLIVIKHVLVPLLLAIAVVSERVFLKRIGDDNPEALKRFRWALNANTVLGAAILLLTSVAQAG